jgi:hypothetical protein
MKVPCFQSSSLSDSGIGVAVARGLTNNIIILPAYFPKGEHEVVG